MATLIIFLSSHIAPINQRLTKNEILIKIFIKTEKSIYEEIIQRTRKLKVSTTCVRALRMFPELHFDPSQMQTSCWTLVEVVVEVVSDSKVWLASL